MPGKTGCTARPQPGTLRGRQSSSPQQVARLRRRPARRREPDTRDLSTKERNQNAARARPDSGHALPPIAHAWLSATPAGRGALRQEDPSAPRPGLPRLPHANTARTHLAARLDGATFFAGVGIGRGHGQRVDAASAASTRNTTDDQVLESPRARTHATLEDLVDARFRLLHHLERTTPATPCSAGVGRLAEAPHDAELPRPLARCTRLAPCIEQPEPAPLLRALADRLKSFR